MIECLLDTDILSEIIKGRVMIAGIALHNQLPLVTGNIAHFEYIRAVGYDLDFENWRDG